MAYQNYKHHNKNNGWWSPTNEYQGYKPREEPEYSRHHVAFRSNYEGSIAEVEAYPNADETEAETTLQHYQRARLGDHNDFESVDQEADAFIVHEHKRMELAQLMSMRTA